MQRCCRRKRTKNAVQTAGQNIAAAMQAQRYNEEASGTIYEHDQFPVLFGSGPLVILPARQAAPGRQATE